MTVCGTFLTACFQDYARKPSVGHAVLVQSLEPNLASLAGLAARLAGVYLLGFGACDL